ncbi:MAG: methyltransferase domain-containing protein, partial [Deltaproteobacteria bacterium]|nr:methyltransferase domain-containing protein [Deltaproteobacteria bacterium]
AGAAGLADMARSILKEKSSPPDRLARHLLRHSDILALGRLADKTRLGQTPPGEDVLSELDTRYRFVQTGDFVRHNEWISQWHLEKGIDPGLTNPKGLLEMARFQVVEELVSALPKGSRVLDYACGQGHFTLALAEKHPDLFFHGVDIAPSSIGVGRQKIVERKLNNVWLFDGQAENLDGEFDLILALEVMEHVQEPGHLSNQLERVLAKGGALCLTVPYGPWEAESYDTMPFRAHIHHFDREDLSALWGHKPDYRVIAVPSRHTERDEPLGVYRVTFGAGGGPAGLLDWQAHLERQAPRETVSVCMIVTPKGLTLARTLESVGPFADQLVIGVDGPEAEGGPAWDIARRYGAEVFSIASPLKTGFDAARNGTLERAACDWVLWIDDDEVFEWPERLIKYLRPNPYQAYAIKQHHYAVEPEGIIKTDYPARLFRNKPGIRFFGVVHEHPETALNEGLGLVLMLPDVAICHNGYDTEDTRRKRFARNLPLMVRDRQTYPQRILGQFLWIRDLAQMNRYALEAGGEMTPAIHKRAVEAVSLWRDLVARDQLRMALDALPYYSDSVMLLTGEGIAFELALGAGRAGVGDTQPPQAPQVRGRFMDTGDIHNITRLMLREKTQFLEEKYF